MQIAAFVEAVAENLLGKGSADRKHEGGLEVSRKSVFGCILHMWICRIVLFLTTMILARSSSVIFPFKSHGRARILLFILEWYVVCFMTLVYIWVREYLTKGCMHWQYIIIHLLIKGCVSDLVHLNVASS